jgi:putative transposase
MAHFIENKRFYERQQKELRRAQRRVARRKKGAHRRAKAVQVLAKLHEHIQNCRLDYLHKVSTRLVRKYGTIVVEKLNVKGYCGSTSHLGTDGRIGRKRR